MERILLYYSSNKQSNALESYVIQLKRRGHEMYFLSTCEEGDLHEFFRSVGVPSCGMKSKTGSFPIAFIRRFFSLIVFCYRNRISIVHSHLHPTNIVAVFAQYFLKSKVIVFRHHLHLLMDGARINSNERLFDKIIARFSRKIVVPSTGVFQHMVDDEGIPASKITVIPYIYDFSQYTKPDPFAVEEIRNKYPCRLRLIMVSRLIKLKRHMVVFPVIKKLVEEGFDIQLLVLDDGDERANLEQWIAENGMARTIHLIGFRRDFINFMAASDMLLQPSFTDASNSAAKEMAFLKKVIAVSDGVGDYSDYVKDGFNGILLPPTDTDVKIEQAIRTMYNSPQSYQDYGEHLRQTVLYRFDVANSGWVMDSYEQLHQS